MFLFFIASKLSRLNNRTGNSQTQIFPDNAEYFIIIFMRHQFRVLAGM